MKASNLLLTQISDFGGSKYLYTFTMKKETALRLTANTLPIVRAAASPVIAKKLETIKPEDRTWKLGLAVGALAVTDKIDGWIARKIGPTKLGGWLDQMADKALVIPIFHTLSKTGEISNLHCKTKIVRDIGITAARTYASRRDINVDAQPLGKYKAVAEMATLAAAASPLSAKAGVIEGMATASTALSLASGAQYLSTFSK